MPTTGHDGNPEMVPACASGGDPVRLQKFLAAAGAASRRRSEDLIRAGRVAVNGTIIREMGVRIQPGRDAVSLDGRPVAPADGDVYILLNKPPGYITSCRQPGRKIVLDLVQVPGRIFPVGRLDADSTGLLLLTSDGPLHHRLSHPSFEHEKEYRIRVDRPVSDEILQKLAAGVRLDDGYHTRPAGVTRVSSDTFFMTLREGRNRQIRRMAASVNRVVTDLCRIRMGPIRLGNLPPGKWRHLNSRETARLRSCR